MKQFFTTIAANLATIALLFLIFVFLVFAIIAAATGASSNSVAVQDNSILIIDLSEPLADKPVDLAPSSTFDRAFGEPGGPKLSLRGAIHSIIAAADDDQIAAIFMRGNVYSDGLSSGYAGLSEMRDALVTFAESGKPIYAYMIDPSVRDYYLTSAATTVTLDPYGSFQFGGLAATQVHLAGFLEKYGIGVQISRVGNFKAAVEPFTRRNMSPENREQTRRYLDNHWSEIKQAVSESRNIDTVRLQKLADSIALFLPNEALELGFVDRVAGFDQMLNDLKSLSTETISFDENTDIESDTSAVESDSTSDREVSIWDLIPSSIPQISLRDYSSIIDTPSETGLRNKIAVIYAQGDIVDGEGGIDQVGGASFSRMLREVKSDNSLKAIVLRVNSPGGSVVASEQIRRELVNINSDIPVVVSFGSLAASGGYWIATAGRRIFTQPNTLTGSIGVFAILPNIKDFSEKHGITTDTVTTARHADMYSFLRPRSSAEMAIIQRSIDVVYRSFINHVSSARNLSPDSVAAIADGRVWSGADAVSLGLADETGGLDLAIEHAVELAGIENSDYGLIELPKRKTTAEQLQLFFDETPTPVAAEFLKKVQGYPTATDNFSRALSSSGPLGESLRTMTREIGGILAFNDPRGMYARLPWALQIQ